MAHKAGPKEKLILQVIEKLPFTDEDKKAWNEAIQARGANEELVKDIQEKAAGLTAEGEAETMALTRNLAELTRQIHAWRLEENLKNVSGSRRR